MVYFVFTGIELYMYCINAIVYFNLQTLKKLYKDGFYLIHIEHMMMKFEIPSRGLISVFSAILIFL